MSATETIVTTDSAVAKLKSLAWDHSFVTKMQGDLAKLEARSAENNAHIFFCIEAARDIEAVLDQFGLNVSLAQAVKLPSLDSIVASCMQARTESGGDPVQLRADLERLLLEARAPMIERFVGRIDLTPEKISLDTLLVGLRKLHDASVKLAALAGEQPGNSLLFGAGQLVTNIGVGVCSALQFSYDPALPALLSSEEPERELLIQLEAATAVATAGTGRDAQQVCAALMIYVYHLCCDAEIIADHFCGASAPLN